MPNILKVVCDDTSQIALYNNNGLGVNADNADPTQCSQCRPNFSTLDFKKKEENF